MLGNKLIPVFIDKIKLVLNNYHEKIRKVALSFDEISNTKFGKSNLKQKCIIDSITRDLMLQSVQMIVDISLNEISINFIESTDIQFGMFYPQVEQIILDEGHGFYNELQEILSPSDFSQLSQLHFSEIKSVFPKSTQRKLHELLFSGQINYGEFEIKKIYDDFIKSGHNIKAKKKDSK